MKIRLERYDPKVFFFSTDSEQATEEAKKGRNENKLNMIFDLMTAGKIDTAYVTDKPNKHTGKYLVKILHRSAKYDALQLTTALYHSGTFLYFLSDQEIESPEKLKREFPKNGTRITIK